MLKQFLVIMLRRKPDPFCFLVWGIKKKKKKNKVFYRDVFSFLFFFIFN